MEIVLLTSQELIEYSKEYDVRIIHKDSECKSHFLNHNNMEFPLSLYLVEVTRKQQAEAVEMQIRKENLC
ncbi:TPA: hypothetical protein U1629_000827 [Streptococcus suis]|nr:hypothetical protein [Streptococcus suis]NQO21516.1 hypothetical protein [Streptococcus suis]NQP14926.1 hypothetical protein [Streptococcus suis]HEM5120711.1 hypothetical protein [Streptococcus suis]HEM5429767.1 hypothetical protein [Streptococcus suis]